VCYHFNTVLTLLLYCAENIAITQATTDRRKEEDLTVSYNDMLTSSAVDEILPISSKIPGNRRGLKI